MRLFLFALLAMPAVALVSACSDEGAKDSTVKVALSEWAVVGNPASVPEGEVSFDVDNEGDETHELLVVKTDFDAAELPTEGDGSVDEGADGIDVIGETNDIDSGDSDGRVFELGAGEYVLLCNLVRDDGKEVHYDLGMRTAFTVTEGE